MEIGCIYTLSRFMGRSGKKPLDTQISIPFGISYVAASLKHHKHNPHIVVLTPQMDTESIISQFIREKNPKMICLTATSSQFEFIKSVAGIIKSLDAGIFIVLGGVHATLMPDDAISIPQIDAVCIGEGENAIPQLCDFLEMNEKPHGIHNLWIKTRDTNHIEKNDVEGFIEDLDALPVIDRKMWYPWIADRDSRPSILIGRGCPNRCAYCSNHALSKVCPGKYVRYRSPENIINELTGIVTDNPKISSIYLEVETLSIDLNYTYRLLDKLEEFNTIRTNKIEFGANFSPNRRIIENEELFERLKRANFTSLNIGLESGSEDIRKNVLKRPAYTNEEIIKFCKMAKKYDIRINMYVIIGIPGETRTDYFETINCVRNCKPDFVQLGIFEPYPGTELYNKGLEEKLFDETVMSHLPANRSNATLDLPGFSKWQIQREYFLFPHKTETGKIPVFKIAVWFLDHNIGKVNFLHILLTIQNRIQFRINMSDFK